MHIKTEKNNKSSDSKPYSIFSLTYLDVFYLYFNSAGIITKYKGYS